LELGIMGSPSPNSSPVLLGGFSIKGEATKENGLIIKQHFDLNHLAPRGREIKRGAFKTYFLFSQVLRRRNSGPFQIACPGKNIKIKVLSGRIPQAASCDLANEI
jgi:hypothetical protein